MAAQTLMIALPFGGPIFHVGSQATIERVGPNGQHQELRTGNSSVKRRGLTVGKTDLRTGLRAVDPPRLQNCRKTWSV